MGYGLVVPGTLLYNEVVIVKYFGLEQNTKRYIAERKRIQEENETEAKLIDKEGI